MTEEDRRFLAAIEIYVSKHPHVAAYVAQYAANGAAVAFTELNSVKADIEACLLAALKLKWKGSEQMVKDKLKRHADRLSFNWSWFYEQ